MHSPSPIWPVFSGLLSSDHITTLQAAGAPAEIMASETSTASLVNVETPSIRTLSSGFLEQDAKTDVKLDSSAEQEAERERAEKDLAKKPKQPNTWLSRLIDAHSGYPHPQAATAANLLGVVGISLFFGYKAWSLHERRAMSWQHVGIGVGVMSIVALGEAFIGG